MIELTATKTSQLPVQPTTARHIPLNRNSSGQTVGQLAVDGYTAKQALPMRNGSTGSKCLPLINKKFYFLWLVSNRRQLTPNTCEFMNLHCDRS